MKWVIQGLAGGSPGVDSQPGVCGGDPCIIRTRIPVWLLEQARRAGSSEQSLLAPYPVLRAEDLVKAFDPDFVRQAERIHEAVISEIDVRDQALRIKRPS